MNPIRPRLPLARGRELDSQRNAPVREEVGGRDRRARKRRPHQAHLGIRSPKSDLGARSADSNEGIEEAGPSECQDESRDTSRLLWGCGQAHARLSGPLRRPDCC